MQLDKGTNKLNRDLDIVNLLEMIKDYHLMKQVLFNQDERFFLKLQRRDLICESSSENEMMSEVELSITKQPTKMGRRLS